MSVIIVIASLIVPNFVAPVADMSLPTQETSVVNVVTIKEDGSITAFTG